MDDDELIASLAGGDDAALRQLFDRHAPWLAARLRQVLPPDDVEDVLQETFLAVWKNAGTYQPRGTPAAWFTDQRRQLSGSTWAGSYVALYTVGYADSRPREPVSEDSYADEEMMSAGSGVAQAVLAKVAPPVATPHCPGTPGC